MRQKEQAFDHVDNKIAEVHFFNVQCLKPPSHYMDPCFVEYDILLIT